MEVFGEYSDKIERILSDRGNDDLVVEGVFAIIYCLTSMDAKA